MNTSRAPSRSALHRRLLLNLFVVSASLLPVSVWSFDDNPATVQGDQATSNGYKYGFEGFQDSNTKYLQQVVTTSNSSGGNKTATTTVDQKTGNRSTHTSGSASSYGGTWSIDSDTARHRSGGSGSQTSSDNTTSSNEYTTEMLKTNVEGWVPAFDGIFTANVNNALISLSPEELSYTVTKLQYQMAVPIASNDAAFWDVVFQPDDGSDAAHDVHAWATNSQTTSQTYAVDPTALNGKAAGTYTVTIEPNVVIQINSFIPQEWVAEPTNSTYIDVGDMRKDPLDDSFTTGTAQYGRELSNRVRHRQTLTTLDKADDDGSIEESTVKPICGQTREFLVSQLVGGHLPAGATPYATATAVPLWDVTVTHPSLGVVVTTVEYYAADPLIPAAAFAPIHFVFTITIDKSVPGKLHYHVTGTHCRFPAYEVYINGSQVHQYSPIPSGSTPLGLFLFDRHIDNQGDL